MLKEKWFEHPPGATNIDELGAINLHSVGLELPTAADATQGLPTPMSG